jgi:hypothetical protein
VTQTDFRRLVRCGLELQLASKQYAAGTDAEARLANAGLACWAQAFETKPLRAANAYADWKRRFASVDAQLRFGIERHAVGGPSLLFADARAS